ncbi:hypothetical protein GCM10017709_07770 [Glutamicibacter nicotianae]
MEGLDFFVSRRHARDPGLWFDAITLSILKSHLTTTAFQQSGGRENSWELALYEAMANDDWYLMTYLELR